jgi:hypothetical protein
MIGFPYYRATIFHNSTFEEYVSVISKDSEINNNTISNFWVKNLINYKKRQFIAKIDSNQIDLYPKLYFSNYPLFIIKSKFYKNKIEFTILFPIFYFLFFLFVTMFLIPASNMLYIEYRIYILLYISVIPIIIYFILLFVFYVKKKKIFKEVIEKINLELNFPHSHSQRSL